MILFIYSWSPDGKYIATGGEDDLITVYSFHENRVICRGRGHRSWVTAISFDPYTTLAHSGELTDYPSDDESLGKWGTTPHPTHCGLWRQANIFVCHRLSNMLLSHWFE